MDSPSPDRVEKGVSVVTPVATGENETLHQINVEAGARTVVEEGDTVPPRVLWQREHRRYTDKLWAVIYAMCYVAFLSCGFVLVARSKDRYQTTEGGAKVISDHFQAEVLTRCGCQDRQDGEASFYDLCDQLSSSEGRMLRAGGSTFDGDEGIFDAFAEAPEIIIGLLSLAVVLAVLWVVLLRFFAKPIVIATEVIKIGMFIYMGVASSNTGTLILCIFIAIGIFAFDVWTRDQLLFAGEVMSHSSIALKENPLMFLGLLAVKMIYVLNAFLFVWFFSSGFNVVGVANECYTDSFSGSQVCSCQWVYPEYVSGISTFLSLAYLWTVILFSKIRLAVIANIVGSWHFHNDDKPTVTRAVINSLSTSIGTLSVAALISTIAERINRLLLEPWYKSWLSLSVFVTLPLQLFLCVFGACIKTFIQMLTKFAIVLHVFTGKPFVASGRKVVKILSRHFLGGFVTEASSKSVLSFGSYVFSIGIALLAWAWFDKRFNTDTISGSESTYVILWIVFGLFNLWYPVLGIYVIILVNRFLEGFEKANKEAGGENYQHIWVAPLASIFVGCIAMMFFTYLAGIILDTIDVLFLCFSIDRDNEVDLEDDGFGSIVKKVPGYCEVLVVETGEVLQEVTVVDGEAPNATSTELHAAKVG